MVSGQQLQQKLHEPSLMCCFEFLLSKADSCTVVVVHPFSLGSLTNKWSNEQLGGLFDMESNIICCHYCCRL
jgi:hypothetical protein